LDTAKKGEMVSPPKSTSEIARNIGLTGHFTFGSPSFCSALPLLVLLNIYSTRVVCSKTATVAKINMGDKIADVAKMSRCLKLQKLQK